MMAAALVWWIVIQHAIGEPENLPIALGPYATRQQCQHAGHALSPRDRNFMTAAQLAKDLKAHPPPKPSAPGLYMFVTTERYYPALSACIGPYETEEWMPGTRRHR